MHQLKKQKQVFSYIDTKIIVKKTLQDTRKKRTYYTNITGSLGERLAANIRNVQEGTCLPLKWTSAEEGLSLRKRLP